MASPTPRQLHCPSFVSSTALPKGNGIRYLGMILLLKKSESNGFPPKKVGMIHANKPLNYNGIFQLLIVGTLSIIIDASSWRRG